MNSIQSRLGTGLIISLISVLIIMWYLISSNIQQLAENYIASRLKHDTETLVTAINFVDDKLVIDTRRIDPIYQRPFSGHYYTIQHNDMIIRSRSLWDKSLEIPEATDTSIISHQTGPEKQLLIVVSEQFVKSNQNISISIAEDLTPIEKDISQFKRSFSIASLIVLLALTLSQILILRRELRPLTSMRNELNELERGNITQLSTNVPEEIKPLTEEINHLSYALNKRLKRSRDALSDLSHAIKKPLTVLQQFFDKHTSSLDASSVEMLNQQISEIQQTTDRVLKRARVAGRSQFNQCVMISDDLPLLVQTINSMYPDKSLTIDMSVPDNLGIHIDREDLLELLGNLLDNAWKWAQSNVSISVTSNQYLTICIEDDGPGADQALLHTLASRGQRLDESVAGYGFGLAIAADIVSDYEGRIYFERSELLGGFKVLLELPIKQ